MINASLCLYDNVGCLRASANGGEGKLLAQFVGWVFVSLVLGLIAWHIYKTFKQVNLCRESPQKDLTLSSIGL